MAARSAAGRHPLWAGIGAYRLSSDEIVASVQAARRLGVDGLILFSYDSLTGPTRGPAYLAQVGRAAFMQ
jgi:dihydrodipicolinate synthase/N-acetylneuraminate lyase